MKLYVFEFYILSKMQVLLDKQIQNNKMMIAFLGWDI